MIQLHAKDIASALHCEVSPEISFQGVSHDTRLPMPGCLYVALLGEQHDGHDFCEQAKAQGAVALLVSKTVSTDLPQIVVPDTVQALGLLAQYWLKRCAPIVVAITGSGGKTSVKNMVAAILSEAYGADNVLKTAGNFNNHIGLPLTLCALSPHHAVAVLEMGMNHLGEIAYLSRLVSPDVACISTIFACHTAGVGGIQGVVAAKTEIFQGLKAGGVAVLNADNPFFEDCRRQLGDKPVIRFSVQHAAEVCATQVNLAAMGSHFMLHLGEACLPVRLSIPGEHYVSNALAASACAFALGIEAALIAKGLGKVRLEKHRMAFQKGLHGVQLIDDCYNANPEAVRLAAGVLLQQPGEKVLVLGDLGELGDEAAAIHAELGLTLAALGITHLFATGSLMAQTIQAFGEGGRHFSDKAQMIAALRPYCREGVVILIKASRFMRFEEVVAALGAQPE